MSKSILCICDWETRFLTGFVEYYLSKSIDILDIKVFSDVDRLLEFSKRRSVDVLLIGNELMNEDIENSTIKKILILSEGDIQKKFSEYPTIYKYQSSEKIISEILNFYADVIKEDTSNLIKRRRMRIIGVYSPVRRSGKTSLALALGQLLAKGKKVLYLNLEEFSGLYGVLNSSYKGDLLDVIFYQRQGSGNMRYKLKGVTSTVNGLDYISPALYSEELRNVECTEWLELIDTIDCQTDYDVLILDIGETVNGLINILEKCSIIYMPQRHDFFSQGKILQFEEYLNSVSKDWILDKVSKVDVPVVDSDKVGGDFITHLSSGSFAIGVMSLCLEEYGGSVAKA